MTKYDDHITPYEVLCVAIEVAGEAVTAAQEKVRLCHDNDGGNIREAEVRLAAARDALRAASGSAHAELSRVLDGEPNAELL